MSDDIVVRTGEGSNISRERARERGKERRLPEANYGRSPCVSHLLLKPAWLQLRDAFERGREKEREKKHYFVSFLGPREAGAGRLALPEPPSSGGVTPLNTAMHIINSGTEAGLGRHGIAVLVSDV